MAVFVSDDFSTASDSRLLFRKLLAKLPADKRTAVWLYHVEMHPASEIAAIMDLPVHVVYRLIGSAVNILRRWFKDEKISAAMLRER